MGQGGVDDWDKVPSFHTGATPRRSTSSLELMRSVTVVLVVVCSLSSWSLRDALALWVEYSNVYATVANFSDESIIAEGQAALKPLGFHRDSNVTRQREVPIRGIFAAYKVNDQTGAIIHQGSRPGCIVFTATNFNEQAAGLANSAAAAVEARFRKTFGESLALFSDAKCSHAL